MKYSVPFTVEVSFHLEIDDVFDEEEAKDEIEDLIDSFDYGKIKVIDDFSYDKEDILYNELEWDEESGCGDGNHEVVGRIEITVEAPSKVKALEIANEKYSAIISSKELSEEYFGKDFYDVNLRAEPVEANVLEVNQKKTITNER